jgi:hypothetical protein
VLRIEIIIWLIESFWADGHTGVAGNVHAVSRRRGEVEAPGCERIPIDIRDIIKNQRVVRVISVFELGDERIIADRGDLQRDASPVWVRSKGLLIVTDVWLQVVDCVVGDICNTPNEDVGIT